MLAVAYVDTTGSPEGSCTAARGEVNEQLHSAVSKSRTSTNHTILSCYQVERRQRVSTGVRGLLGFVRPENGRERAEAEML